MFVSGYSGTENTPVKLSNFPVLKSFGNLIMRQKNPVKNFICFFMFFPSFLSVLLGKKLNLSVRPLQKLQILLIRLMKAWILFLLCCKFKSLVLEDFEGKRLIPLIQNHFIQVIALYFIEVCLTWRYSLYYKLIMDPIGISNVFSWIYGMIHSVLRLSLLFSKLSGYAVHKIIPSLWSHMLSGLSVYES